MLALFLNLVFPGFLVIQERKTRLDDGLPGTHIDEERSET